jgi:protein TonB
MKKVCYILALIFCVNSFCYSHQPYETQAEFPGGEEARKKYIKENLRYPQSAIDSGIEGIVFVGFVVERDGSITNAQIIRSIRDVECPECDEEAIRLVEEMPNNWIPGKQGLNKESPLTPVRQQFFMPIKFSLDEYQQKNNMNDE